MTTSSVAVNSSHVITRKDLRAVISKGSKSFYFASLFFPHTIRGDCWILYRWCRHCDDRIDHAPNSYLASVELARLREKTIQSLRTGAGSGAFKELGELCTRHEISHKYPLEMISGFKKDVCGYKYETLNDVEEYSYQVAGVVGVMMAKVMGVHEPAAEKPACSMGIAMQLTNIARDVAEDFDRGRVYLPNSWLKDRGIKSTELLVPENRERVFSVVCDLLNRADEHYRTGYSGLAYLPLRPRIAVAIAASVYQAIGRKLIRRGPNGILKRTYISPIEKAYYAMKGIFRAINLRTL